MMNLDENTIKKAAVIGHPVAQSLSPLIHKHWFSETGIKGDYIAVDVLEGALEQQLEIFKNEGYTGFNLTVPHKTAIIPFLDKLAPLARQMGAVNTVKINPDGTTTGFNTDGIGLMQHLKLSAPGWQQDRPALVLGAGGAARAACLGLLTSNVPMVMIANRTREKAEAIADEIGRGRIVVVDWGDRENALAGAGLVVNTTVLGMTGQLPLDLDLVQVAVGTIVYDIVYKPLQTELLAQATDRGLVAVDGLGMLVHQGAAAFKIWFGVDVGLDERLRNKLDEALS
ncbi:shikimate dehydrogenase [Kordiimonas aquimaris]|uniref:shikimate dehydrogenase n=1 Tax=Kordiimonas aquimaris TaxID=707591 RepID=UPI0021CE4526|nr:shikimate dehydrogenase [Kordiimonas aquimaris]